MSCWICRASTVCRCAVVAAASAGDSLASIAASADVAVGKDNMFIRPVWIAVRWLGSPPSSRFSAALKTVPI